MFEAGAFSAVAISHPDWATGGGRSDLAIVAIPHPDGRMLAPERCNYSLAEAASRTTRSQTS
jgi:hypothetical protein